MFLNEFDHPKQKFHKIQTYLKENYNIQIKTADLTMSKANRLIKSSLASLSRLDERKSPREYTKLTLMLEGLKLWKATPNQMDLSNGADSVAESIEDSIEEAKVILAANELSDQLQKMVEDLAEMQVQTLMPIVDAMKTEIGSAEAERFNSAVDGVLGELLDIAKNAKDTVIDAILVASGKASESDFASDEFDAPDMGGDFSDSDFGDIEASPGEMDSSPNRELKMESYDFNSLLEEIKSKCAGGKISRKDLDEVIEKAKKNKKKTK